MSPRKWFCLLIAEYLKLLIDPNYTCPQIILGGDWVSLSLISHVGCIVMILITVQEITKVTALYLVSFAFTVINFRNTDITNV